MRGHDRRSQTIADQLQIDRNVPFGIEVVNPLANGAIRNKLSNISLVRI